MGSDDSKGTPVIHFRKYCFCNCTSRGRLCTGSELIDKDKRLAVGHFQHGLHVLEEGTVGTQVILYALVVSDTHQYPFENGKFRSLGSGNQHTPLEHVLQQSCGLQADGFASGVRSRDEEDPLCRCQYYGHRHDGAFFLGQGLFQKRMTSLAQVHFPAFGDERHTGFEIQGYLGLSDQEVYLAKVFGGIHQGRYIGADEIAESSQDAVYFQGFFGSQGIYFILQFNDFGRLDKGCFPSCRGVEDEAWYFFLAGTVHRDEKLPFPDGKTCVRFHDAIRLCLLQDGIGPLGDGAFL